jgi:hypothetical protein
LAEERQLNRHGGKRVKGEQADGISMPQRGTSRASIISRLKRENLLDLVEAVERGKISAYAIAVELGWAKRRPTYSGDDSNQAKRRAWALRKIFDPSALIG